MATNSIPCSTCSCVEADATVFKFRIRKVLPKEKEGKAMFAVCSTCLGEWMMRQLGVYPPTNYQKEQ